MKLPPAAIVVQARMESSRLPGKALREIQSVPLILHLLKRLKDVPAQILVTAISRARESDPLYFELFQKRCNVYRGDPTDVYHRVAEAVRDLHVDAIVRVTADNPLTDGRLIVPAVKKLILEDLDYLWIRNIPVGMGFDVFKRDTYYKVAGEALGAEEKEHIVPAFRNRTHLKGGFLDAGHPVAVSKLRYTVDTEADFTFIEAVFQRYHQSGRPLDLDRIIEDGLAALHEKNEATR